MTDYDWRLDAQLSYLEAIKELRIRLVKARGTVALNDDERRLQRGEGI